MIHKWTLAWETVPINWPDICSVAYRNWVLKRLVPSNSQFSHSFCCGKVDLIRFSYCNYFSLLSSPLRSSSFFFIFEQSSIQFPFRFVFHFSIRWTDYVGRTSPHRWNNNCIGQRAGRLPRHIPEYRSLWREQFNSDKCEVSQMEMGDTCRDYVCDWHPRNGIRIFPAISSDDSSNWFNLTGWLLERPTIITIK